MGYKYVLAINKSSGAYFIENDSLTIYEEIYPTSLQVFCQEVITAMESPFRNNFYPEGIKQDVDKDILLVFSRHFHSLHLQIFTY